MNPRSQQVLEVLYERHPALLPCRPQIALAARTLCEMWASGHKLLICGNGGSAADSLHIVAELMKGFAYPRPIPAAEAAAITAVAGADASYLNSQLQGTLPAIALVSEVALTTAFSNDVAADLIFAQQVYGYGAPGDTLLAISTSGNSRNVVYATQVARAKGLHTIALTGATGGKLATFADITIPVPETEVYKVQELHLPVYHALCLAAEEEFFGQPSQR